MRNFAIVMISGLLAGCAALPSTGPSLSCIEKAPNQDHGIELVPVTRMMAQSFHTDQLAQLDARINTDLASLRASGTHQDIRLQPGDTIHVTVSSWSPIPATDKDPMIKTDWTLQLNAAGTVRLPYLKRDMVLTDKTIPDVQTALQTLYQSGKVFLDPTIHVTFDTQSIVHGVVVTGLVGAPKIVPWTPGGMTASEVITQALGNGTSLGSPQSDFDGGKSAVTVTVIRPGYSPMDLPIDTVMQQDFPVTPQDRFIISRKPVVQITVAGGGVSNGELRFDQHPSLAQALAESKGLNAQTANAKSVFVLRNIDHPIIYSFAYKTLDAQFASQQFPMHDGDVVYVSEAPIVPVESVVQAIWPFLSVASMAR